MNTDQIKYYPGHMYLQNDASPFMKGDVIGFTCWINLLLLELSKSIDEFEELENP